MRARITTRFAISVCLPALFALTSLNACKAAEAPKEACVVSATDIENINQDFKTHFATLANDIAAGNTPNDNAEPKLNLGFAAPVSMRATVNTSGEALRYTWSVSINDGCILDARLGTNSEQASGPTYNVKALRLNGTINPDGTLVYAPMAVVLDK